MTRPGSGDTARRARSSCNVTRPAPPTPAAMPTSPRMAAAPQATRRRRARARMRIWQAPHEVPRIPRSTLGRPADNEAPGFVSTEASGQWAAIRREWLPPRMPMWVGDRDGATLAHRPATRRSAPVPSMHIAFVTVVHNHTPHSMVRRICSIDAVCARSTETLAAARVWASRVPVASCSYRLTSRRGAFS